MTVHEYGQNEKGFFFCLQRNEDFLECMYLFLNIYGVVNI